MGTRSVVAIPQGDSWKGRYVHWDGYPSGVGAALLAIRQHRYPGDLPGMIKMLTVDHWYWSSLAGPDQGPTSSYDGDLRFVAVPGVGVAGTIDQAKPDEWITPDEDAGCEWCYVLTDAGIVVLEARRDGDHAMGMFGFNPGASWAYVATVPWDLTPWVEGDPDPQGPGWEAMVKLG